MRNDRSNLTQLNYTTSISLRFAKKKQRIAKKTKKKKQRDSRVSKNCKSNSRNWARRHHPTHGQGMLEYLSSTDSFARSENINLKALSFATKKQRRRVWENEIDSKED